MNPAIQTPSRMGRIRTVALAATIALGALFPALPVTNAQDTGFDIASATSLSGLTAVVSGSNDGLNLRAEPRHDAGVLSTLPDGTVVDLLVDRFDTVRDEDGTTRWWPVSINGQTGWVSGFYLSDSGNAPATIAAPETTSFSNEVPAAASSNAGVAFSFNGASLVGATARIAGAGESVNLRSQPTVNSELVTSLSDQTIVSLRIDELDTVVDGDTRWWPVSVNGMTGWVSGFFLEADDGTTTPSTSTTTTTTGNQGSKFAAGQYATTYTGVGDGVNLRADATQDGALLETLAEGTVVQVMEGPVSFDRSSTGWFKVTVNGLTGYADGDLLRAASQPGSSTDAATGLSFIPGDYAKVVTATQAGARIRAGGSPESDRTGFVPESGVVRIVAGPVSYDTSDRGWFEITFDGQSGYVDGDLLVKTDPPPAPEPQPEEQPAESGTFASGEAVVTNSRTGVGVNIRVAPGIQSDRVGYLADASALNIVGGPQADLEGDTWYEVTNGVMQGWVAGNLLDRPSATANVPAAETTPRFILPLASYTLTQNYGCSSFGYYTYNATAGCNLHDGTDLATRAGTDIHASGDGTVVFSGWCDCGLGYYVEIDHGDGIHTVYGHQQRQPPVKVGQVVKQGDVIGYVGSTGLSTGPHVHFMVRVNGVAVDAHNYVDF